MLTTKNLIKNTSKLHHIHQRRGVLRVILRDFCKNNQGPSAFNCFLQKTPSQEPGRVPNTCHKIVVRKFPSYILKQKRAKQIKI